jgi:hypothetical protein
MTSLLFFQIAAVLTLYVHQTWHEIMVMIQRVEVDIWRDMTQLRWPPTLQVGTVKHPVHRNILHDHLPETTIDIEIYVFRDLSTMTLNMMMINLLG